MKQRTYHREELDTTSEVVGEFQQLRDETVAEFEALNKRLERLEKRKPK